MYPLVLLVSNPGTFNLAHGHGKQKTTNKHGVS